MVVPQSHSIRILAVFVIMISSLMSARPCLHASGRGQQSPTEQGWGQPRDGLQIRLATEGGRTSFFLGEQVRLTITLRNVSANRVTLQLRVPERWIFDVTSENVSVTPITSYDSFQEVVLEAGEDKVFTGPEFRLRPLGSELEPDAVILMPGKYTVQCWGLFMTGGDRRATVVRAEAGSLEIEIEDPPDSHSPRVLSDDRLPSIPGVTWGEMAGGLRAGLAMKDGKENFATGESVSTTVFLRNVTDAELTILYLDTPDWEWYPRICDLQGKIQQVQYVPTTLWNEHRTAMIKPGEILEIGHPIFVVGSDLDPHVEAGKPGIFVATPGQYIVSCSLAFRYAGPAKVGPWVHIITGRLPFATR